MAEPAAAAVEAPFATATPGPAPWGANIFVTQGCSICHSRGDDAIVGPGHGGLFERAGTRVEGLTAEEYLRQSILRPAAYVVPGFNNIMPNNYGSMSANDLEALIVYLKTLD